MKNKKSYILISAFIACFLMLLSSCNTKPAETDDDPNTNIDINDTNQNENVTPSNEDAQEVRIDPYVFLRSDPVDVTEKTFEGSSYTIKTKRFTSLAEFKEVYGEKEFKRAEFERPEGYVYYNVFCTYGQYLYFYADRDTEQRVFRYDMKNDVTEDVFTYNGEYKAKFSSVNDEYLIWFEDEDADMLKLILHCYNMKTQTDETVYTYPRNERGTMYTWGAPDPVLYDGRLYFSAVVEGENYYDMKWVLQCYDIANKQIEQVREGAMRTFSYNGVSWIEFDGERDEYVIKSLDADAQPIYLGRETPYLRTSSKYLASRTHKGADGIMYNDGTKSVPIIETTQNISDVCCSDDFIMWNSISDDYPMFYDIGRNMIVYANVIEGDRQYTPYLSDDYLVFEAKDTVTADGLTTTKKLIYYYIATDELN